MSCAKIKDYQSFNFGSGNHNQTATMNMVVSVKTLTQSGAEVNSIIRPLIAIIMLAIHLALRGTVPLARQSRNVGHIWDGLTTNHPFVAIL